MYIRITVKKALLRKQNNFKRLQWDKAHPDWTKEQWKKVIWIDKSKFEIFWSNRRAYVRQRFGERAATYSITPTIKHEGGSVMVFRAFANCKVSNLHHMKGKFNQNRYHSKLQHQTIPFGRQLMGRRFVLMQYNDPKYTSKLCQRYMKSKEEQHILLLMAWLAQSEELNPIELVWNELDQKVIAKQPTRAAYLWWFLQER